MPDRTTKDGYIVSSKFRIGLFYAYLVAIGILAFFVTRTVLANAHVARQAHDLAVANAQVVRQTHDLAVANTKIVRQEHKTNCAQKRRAERSIAETRAVLTNPDDQQNMKIIAALGKPLLLRSLAAAKSDLKTYEGVKC